MVCFIIWEMHGFPHQFPIIRVNAAKPIVWGEPGKLVLIFFAQYGSFFPIRFPFYDILHYMGNACVFSPIFHNMGKRQPNLLNSESLRNQFPYFFDNMGGFFIRFSSFDITHHMGNAWAFSSVSHSMRKGRKTHRMGKVREIGLRENPIKPVVCGEPGKLLPILFPQYGCFFPIRFTFYGILHNMENAWISPSISHTMGKCSEIHQIGRAWEIGTNFFPKLWTPFFYQVPILWYTLPHGKCINFLINF